MPIEVQKSYVSKQMVQYPSEEHLHCCTMSSRTLEESGTKLDERPFDTSAHSTLTVDFFGEKSITIVFKSIEKFCRVHEWQFSKVGPSLGLLQG